jgi:hypothetical protein
VTHHERDEELQTKGPVNGGRNSKKKYKTVGVIKFGYMLETLENVIKNTTNLHYDFCIFFIKFL